MTDADFPMFTPVDPLNNAPTPVPWDGNIDWTTNGAGVFDDSEEAHNAVVNQSNLPIRERSSNTWMVQNGLRYMPPSDTVDAFRTVKIDLLPAYISLAQILFQIRNFEIYCAYLLNTINLSGSKTAVITFVRQTTTALFLHHTVWGLQIGDHLARVSLVETPTSPIPWAMERLITQDGYTRCLVVWNMRANLKMDLAQFLQHSSCRDYIEAIEDGDTFGEVQIWFHSIKMASVALGLLQRIPWFQGSRIRFHKSSHAEDA